MTGTHLHSQHLRYASYPGSSATTADHDTLTADHGLLVMFISGDFEQYLAQAALLIVEWMTGENSVRVQIQWETLQKNFHLSS